MSDLDYIDVDITTEFPALWKEFIDQNSLIGITTEFPALWKEFIDQNSLIGSSKFNNFLKSKNINGFAIHGTLLGNAKIRHDHLMWMKLKY